MIKSVVFSLPKKIVDAVLILSFFLSSLLLSYINIVLSCGFCYENAVTCASMDKVRQEFTLASALSLKDIFKSIFKVKTAKPQDQREIMVYPGGFPLGFTLECDGVVVVACGEVQTEYGMVNVLENKNIKVGDILYSINGQVITSANHLQQIINRDDYYGDEIDVVVKRKQTFINEKLFPQKEVSSDLYRLGLWIRDNAAGVGTLTYVRADNGRFGALGHPVCDIDTGTVMPISSGNIYKCNIVGFNKGSRGNPGELRGLFLKNGEQAGNLDFNNEYGVYGSVSEEYLKKLSGPIPVGFRDSVKTGKAKILCTIDGTTPQEYSVEIIKLTYQAKSDKKSMVIKVTDKALIDQTGGIVQGMSGSPIIQNGKLVGAVTHVFISDPTKGFGLYIDWMIDN